MDNLDFSCIEELNTSFSFSLFNTLSLGRVAEYSLEIAVSVALAK